MALSDPSTLDGGHRSVTYRHIGWRLFASRPIAHVPMGDNGCVSDFTSSLIDTPALMDTSDGAYSPIGTWPMCPSIALVPMASLMSPIDDISH
jgi:hypothetical protein